MRQRILALAAALAVVATIGTRAAAVGTIDTTDATIESGAAPTRGTVTIDPAAPIGVAPVLPGIEEPGDAPIVTGSMPPLPSFGDGGEGAFSATTGTVALTPGTHQFTSFDITNGASVTVSGATTILVQGAVSIAGRLTSSTQGAGITIRCGGDFTLVSRSPASLVQTTEASSPIEIVAGGNMAIGTGVNNLDAQVTASSSDVTIDAYGVDAVIAAIRIQSGRILAPAGSITTRCNGWFSSGGVLSTRPGVIACRGPLWIRSFASNVTANSNGTFSVTAGSATLECDAWLFVGGRFDVSGTGSATFSTTKGPCDLTGGVTTANGDVTIRSGGTTDVREQEVTAGGSGRLSLSTSGDLLCRGSPVRSTGSDVDLVAGGTIRLEGAASLSSDTALRLSSSGGDFRMFNTSELVGLGAATVRVAGDVFVGEATPPEKRPSGDAACVLDVGSMEMSAGGDVTLDAVTTRATAIDGTFRVLSGGALTIAGAITAPGDITLQSQGGDVDVLGVSLTTGDMAQAGAIRVETWKPGGRIDAVEAIVRSGSSAGQSGNVDLLVHDPGATVIKPFILPKIVRLKLRGEGKDSLKAAGVYDDGGNTVDYGQPVTIQVGDFERTFTVEPNRSGATFKFKGPDVTLMLRPNRSDSSRGFFVLVISKTTLAGLIDPDAPLSMHFTGTGLPDAAGRFELTGGGYRIGRTRGTLIAPEFFLTRIRATVRDGKPDTMKMKGGFRTDGPVPATLGTVVIAVGDTFRLSVPGSEFRRSKDRFTYQTKASGVSIRLFVDFGRELVQIVTKGAELGDLSGPTTDVEFDAGDGRGAVRGTVVLGANGDSRGY